MEKIKRTLLLISICLLILISACGLKTNNNSTTASTWWYIDTNSPPLFHTNDISLAVKEVPFNLVFPTYLPGDLDPKQPDEIYGPYKTAEIIVEVEIRYWKITIVETNEFINRIPSLPTSRYLDIGGIKVLQEEGGITIFPANTFIPTNDFTWNQNGIFFDVTIEKTYSNEAAVKIVESMINNISK
jgi:hypothetical protein